MKIQNILFTVLCSAALVSCNDFLDTMPDNRAEIDTKEKIANLLASAYPDRSPIMLKEFGTDNYMDNGVNYNYMENQYKIYHWEQVSTTSNDDPKGVWSAHYQAVASANQALKAIDELGNPATLAAQRGEALMCRAYAIFEMANTFCMPYNPATADSTLGLPYPTEPETKLIVEYKRGTLKELYQKIDKDIEEALPLIDDNSYKVLKYHFNRAAAYALAARFNLYYGNYKKAVEYASVTLGKNPMSVLRDQTQFITLGSHDVYNSHIKASDPANLMLQTAYSIFGRAVVSSSFSRYGHSRDIVTNETIWARAPWGSGSTNNALYYSHKLYNTNQQIWYPRMYETFEYTDKVGGTGYAHTVYSPFSGDLTLLVRAEANALAKNYEAAVSDINYFMESHCAARTGTATRPVMTIDNINSFMNSVAYTSDTIYSTKDRTIKKRLQPQGFTVEEGTQENIIQLILHCHRLESLYLGERWNVIGRYGIKVCHVQDGEQPIFLVPGDKRLAIQLPEDVIQAGLEANPR